MSDQLIHNFDFNQLIEFAATAKLKSTNVNNAPPITVFNALKCLSSTFSEHLA